MNGAAGEVTFHARRWARVMGAACVLLGLFLAAGALSASDVGPVGGVVIVVAAGAFVYVGSMLAWGFVSAGHGVLSIRDGLRVRRIDASSITGLEMCDARLYIAGQRTVAARVGDELVRLNLLARYPTPAGLRRLDEQQSAITRALGLGSPNHG